MGIERCSKNIKERGEGFTLIFFVKLDHIEIAVDQKTRARDRNFGGFQVPTDARGTATLIFGQFLAQFCQIALTCSKPYFLVLYL